MESIAEIFSDVEPIEQDDGPTPVVRIAYSKAFTIIMGYFRRVLVDEEFSKRSLMLSAEVIDHNAANYTAWQYRRKCIRELHKASSEEERKAAWQEELEYCSEQCINNMKNYQVWFHRRACIAALNDATGELDFVACVLEEDAKNYHAWGHRQWVLKTFGSWERELAYVDGLLEVDVRNNSAWNQRYFVLKETADLTSDDLIASEIAYTLKRIALAPSNQSPWGYVKGLVEPLGYAKFPQLRQAVERLAVMPSPTSSGTSAAATTAATAEGAESGAAGASESPPVRRIIPAMALLVDMLLESSEAADVARAAAMCDELVMLDGIRERYWRWRQSRADPTATKTPPPAETKIPKC